MKNKIEKKDHNSLLNVKKISLSVIPDPNEIYIPSPEKIRSLELAYKKKVDEKEEKTISS